VRTVSEPDGNGGRRYRKRKTTRIRPKEEWIAVPVPAFLSRSLVDLARTTMESNKGAERKYLAREWELRGIMRCSCGSTMGTHTTQPRGGRVYHYYKCKRRSRLGKTGSCRQKALRPTEVEPAVWNFVSELLKDPEKIKAGMERIIDAEAAMGRGDPERESEAWAEKLEECARLRSAYQQQQAAGLMTLEELGSMLKDLEETRKLAEAEIAGAAARKNRMEELERDRDDLLSYMSDAVTEGLESLSGEERNRLYRMLRLEVRPFSEGYEVKGIFCSTSLPPSKTPKVTTYSFTRCLSGCRRRRRARRLERPAAST
jgi:site-specific DNA recombinase